MKRVAGFILAAALIAAAAPGSAQAQSKPPVKIGMLQMLTGDLAQYGIPLRDAGVYAVDEANARGGINGHHLELYTEDVGSTPQGSVQATLKLIERDKVDVLMQGGTSGHTLATIPIADERHVPMCTMSTAESITKQGSKWTFRVARVPNSVLDRKFAQYAVKEASFKRIAVIYGNDEMGHDAANNFIAGLQALDVKPVVVEQVQPGDPDVSAQVTRIKAADPDAVFIQGHATEATKIIRTIRQLIPGKLPLLGYDEMTTTKFMQDAGGPANLEGMIVRTGMLGEQSPDPDTQAFVNAYRAKHPNADMLFPMIQYAGMQVLFEAIRLAGDDITPTALRDAFYRVKDFKTILGPVSVQPSGETMDVVNIEKFADGKWQVVTANY